MKLRNLIKNRRKKRTDDCFKVPSVVNNEGYEVVTLRKPDGTWELRYVHELVAKAFVSNPDNKKYIRHKDGNKLNNNANNLEWVDEPE